MKKPKPKQFPALEAELWPLDKIIEYPNNPRTHPQDQIELLARLLKRGIDQPIVVDEDGIILKGHGRKMAAALAGFTEFPVVQRFGLSESEKRAERMSDNVVALMSGWSSELLRTELGQLQTEGYNLPMVGFTDKQLAALGFAPATPRHPDEVVEPPKKPVVQVGDLWVLGQHRILCGDSTDKASWRMLMAPGETASMVWTDPPYGVSYEARSGDFAVIEGDTKRRDDLYKMLVAAFKSMVHVTSNQAAFYVWHASSTRNDFTQAMTAAALEERQYLIWAKPSISLGWGDYKWAHEPCFYAAKAGGTAAFYGEAHASTIWRIESVRTKEAATVIGPGLAVLDGQGQMLYVQAKAPKSKRLREIRLSEASPKLILAADNAGTSTVWEVSRDSGYVHPTQKPVELATRAIENSSRPTEIVVDGFSGSGTLLIGCEMTGRRARVMDLDPKYVQAAIERWQNFTGQEAMLGDQTFAEVAQERQRGRRASQKKTPATKAGASRKAAVRAQAAE